MVMENRSKYTCNKCGHRWRSRDYGQDETTFKYHHGYKCPQCEDDDISMEDDD